LLFLLRQWHRSGDNAILDMVTTTLDGMRLGGIYDHLGYGFHRYSTDARWLVPHFEKMLYDQALLSVAYTEAWQATGNDTYAQTVQEIITYVLRDMTTPEGGFYSALDADSEGEEGRFYLWTEDEIRTLLTTGEAEFVIRIFSVIPAGNYTDESSGERTGRNILHLKSSLNATEKQSWRAIRNKLFQHRQQRIHPQKDDKVLTDWNGLMIAALARSGQVLDRPDYITAAEKAAGFILTALRDSTGHLLHCYRNGRANVAGHADDYAFLIWGLLELYEATFQVEYLNVALELKADMLDRFWDVTDSGFFFTSVESESLPVRTKELYDGAVPSGNSVAALNLLRLGRITADRTLEEKAMRLHQAFAGTVNRSPSAYTYFLSTLDFALGPSCEVVITGLAGADDTQAMLTALRRSYYPNRVVLFRPESDPAITRLAPYTAELVSLDGRATAYVCRRYACQAPTTDIETMLASLKAH
jgi:uncharacterized protein YyaL (SSP411 family)